MPSHRAHPWLPTTRSVHSSMSTPQTSRFTPPRSSSNPIRLHGSHQRLKLRVFTCLLTGRPRRRASLHAFARRHRQDLSHLHGFLMACPRLCSKMSLYDGAPSPQTFAQTTSCKILVCVSNLVWLFCSCIYTSLLAVHIHSYSLNSA